MKIENLKIGQTYKYKELCEALEIKPTSKANNSRIAQFKELERYCKYHKEGVNKAQVIIIDSINKEVGAKVDKKSKGNNSKHIDNIEYMLLILMNKFDITENDRVGFSKNLLFSHCGLTNENYKIVKGNTLKFSQMIDMPVQTINECFDYTNNRMLSTLQSALNRLRKKALITWGSGYNMVMIDENNQEYLQVADIADEKIIMHIEKSMLDEWGYSNKRNVFLSGQWNKFKEQCTEKLKYIYPNVKFYYDNIYFNYNHCDIAKELTELENLDKEIVKQEVNTNFSKSLDGTIDRRHKKAKETTFGEAFKPIGNYRKSTDYKPQQKQIKDIIIKSDSEKIKLENNFDKTKVKYLQKSFFEEYSPTSKQIEFNDMDIAEVPF